MGAFIAEVLAWLAGIFVLGTLGFWVVIVLASIFIIWALEYERGGRATFIMLLTVGGIILSNTTIPNLFAWISEHYILTPLLVLGFFVGAAVCAIYKWDRYTRHQSRQYDELKENFLERRIAQDDPDRVKILEVGKIPDKLKNDWLGYLGDSRYPLNRAGGHVPRAKEHKAMIMRWMGHWPLLAIWAIINDPVKYALREIYAFMAGVLEKISIRNFRGTEEDFFTTEQRAAYEAAHGPAPAGDGTGEDENRGAQYRRYSSK